MSAEELGRQVDRIPPAVVIFAGLVGLVVFWRYVQLRLEGRIE